MDNQFKVFDEKWVQKAVVTRWKYVLLRLMFWRWRAIPGGGLIRRY